jgi:hypothetical protein
VGSLYVILCDVADPSCLKWYLNLVVQWNERNIMCTTYVCYYNASPILMRIMNV